METAVSSVPDGLTTVGPSRRPGAGPSKMSGQPAVRRTAVRRVAADWPDDPGTLPLLHDVAVNVAMYASPEVQAVASSATQLIAVGWPDHPGTVPLLHEVTVHNPTTPVSLAAVTRKSPAWKPVVAAPLKPIKPFKAKLITRWSPVWGFEMKEMLDRIEAAEKAGDTKTYDELTRTYTIWADSYLIKPDTRQKP